MRGGNATPETPSVDVKGKNVPGRDVNGTVPFVRLDPQHQTTVGGKVIEIPDPAYQVETLLSARKADYVHQELDKEDMAIFELDVSKASASQTNHYDPDGDDDYIVTAAPVPSKGKTKPKPKDDWKSDSERLANVVENLMLPPFQSSPSASMAIQRELKAMLREQEAAPSLRDLGWYIPPELIGDNLYQWIVELHSLDHDLPLTKDMKAQSVPFLSPRIISAHDNFSGI